MKISYWAFLCFLVGMGNALEFKTYGQTGASITVGWSASPDTRTDGYNLYYGVASQVYTNVVPVGNVTNATVSGLVPGTTYFFNVTATDAFGDESPFCNEVSGTTSSGTTTSNTPPTISSIANQTINENSSTGPLAFTIGDQETPATNLTLSAASSNLTLVPNSSIVLSGSGSNRTVTITPATGQTGVVSITVTVCDPSLCTSTSFQVSVNALAPPAVSLSSPAAGASYTAPATVNLAANVTANGHTISQVQFLNGSTVLGTSSTAPYAYTWASVPAGSYTLSATAIYDSGSSVASSGVGITVASAPTLAPPWQTMDVGAVGVAGSATSSSGVYTVKGAGTIAGSSDSFRFVYQNLSGDGEIRAQISSLQNTSGSALSGVMIRESLTAGSAYALMGVSASGAFDWQQRNKTSGGSGSTQRGTGTFPNTWVRLVRTGNTLYGYESSDGTTWTLVKSRSISMAQNIYVGMAVASGSSTTLTTSVINNVTVVP